MAIRSHGTQLLWIMNQLEYFNLFFNQVPILCDNTSVISLSKYIVHHSRAKNIGIKHQFIRDHVKKGDFLLKFVDSSSC